MFGCIVLFIMLVIFLYALTHIGIEKPDFESDSRIRFALSTSLSILFKALLNKSTNTKLKSNTYKILLTLSMTLGFVILSYYRAQLNAALNIKFQDISLKSWSDVDKTNFKIIVWPGTISESKFKDAPIGSLKRKIYDEKINVHEKHINDMKGYENSVLLIAGGDYIVYGEIEPYRYMDNNLCKIIFAKDEFR